MVADLREGWHGFRSRTWLWAIVLQFSLVNAAVAGVRDVLGPVQAQEHLGGAGAYGAIVSAAAVGLVLGGVVMLRFRPRRMLLVATLAVLVEVVQPLLWGVPASVPALALGAFVTGAAIEVSASCGTRRCSSRSPPEQLSRLYAYDLLGSIALLPLELAVVGPIANVVGVRATRWGAAALIVAATLPVLLVRDVRELRQVA
jgi:hypothetical protein